MATPAISINRILTRILFPRDDRTILVQQIVLVGVVVAAIGILGPVIALALAALAVGGVALLAMPSRYVIALFVLFMAFTHQFRSFFTIAAAGIEWHPRELLFAVVLAHFTIRLAIGRVHFVADPINLFVGCIAAFFALTAFWGIVQQRNFHLIVSEIRSPVFLASFCVFVGLGAKQDLRWYARLLVGATIVTATVSIAFFAYTFLSGHVVSTQNVLGEFVQRRIAGKLVQSVRPAGHMYYEVCLVVLTSLAFGPVLTRRRRFVYFGFIGILSVAIAITMMRTAYVSVLVSLALLAFLALPSNRARFTIAWLGTVVAVIILGMFSTVLHETLMSAFPRVGVSLQNRLVEISGAYRAFARHPVIGTGMGSTFEALGLATKTSQIAYAQSSFQTIHNVWMYYLFKGGLLGTGIILLGYGGLFMETCRRIALLTDPVQRYFMRGLAAALGAQMVASLAMPRLLYAKGYVFLAMVAAYAVLVTPRQASRADADAVPAPSDGAR